MGKSTIKVPAKAKKEPDSMIPLIQDCLIVLYTVQEIGNAGLSSAFPSRRRISATQRRVTGTQAFKVG